MKMILKILLISTLFIAAPIPMLAQQPPHPNGGNNPNAGNGPVGGGAPLGGDLTVLIALCSVYGSYKLFLKHSTAIIKV
jgi:hypothetical protein